MTEKKVPQDHKKSKNDLAHYSFDWNGKTYHMREGYSFADVASPGFMRKNRKGDQMDVVFNMFELLYSEETLSETVDQMTREEFEEFSTNIMEAMQEYTGASLGES